MNRALSLLSRCYFSSILALQHPLLLTGSPEASLSPKGLLAFFWPVASESAGERMDF